MKKENVGVGVFVFCRACVRGMGEQSLRAGDIVLLNVLCTQPGVHTPATLAADLGVSKPMITARLNKLIHEGYAVRLPSPTDGRSVYIMPTKKSIDMIAQIEQASVLTKIKEKLGTKNFSKFLELISLANNAIS